MSDELMELPEGWEWTDLGDLIELFSGFAFKSKEYETSGIPILRMGNIQRDFTLNLGKERQPYIAKDRFPEFERYLLEEGDIVITLTDLSDTGKYLGTVARLPKGSQALLNQRVSKLRFAKLLDADFLFYALQEPRFRAYMESDTTGTLQKNTNHEYIYRYSFSLPPLNEQKRIVAAIESLRDRSQKARSALSAIPELCDKFRQSVLAAAFRGDLTADWREQNPDVEPASVLLERIKRDRQNSLIKQKVNLEEIELSSLPEIPDTWKWERLINISGLLGGVTKGRKFNGQATVQAPYLRVGNVQDGFLDLEEIKEIEVLPEDINKYRLEHGDILFTEGGDRDKLGRGTVWQGEIEGCIHQNHVYRARLFNSDTLSEYISLVAKTKYAKDYFFHNASQTVNLASINISTLGKLPLPIPPTDEQKEICSRVYKLFEIAEVIKSNYYNLFHQFNQIDRSILAKAFRGELVEQDPNDEPASVLLDRIRAEREQQTQGKAKKPGKKGQRTIKAE